MDIEVARGDCTPVAAKFTSPPNPPSVVRKGESHRRRAHPNFNTTGAYRAMPYSRHWVGLLP